MTMFMFNLALAIVWQAVTASFSMGGLMIGFVVGYAVLWIARPVFGNDPYFWKLWRIIGFFFYFLKELVVSSLKVAWDVVTPPIYARPGVVRVPIDARTDLEITLLANLITLTPGTLTLDVAPDRKSLYVHAMFIDDPEKVRAEIKNGMERRLLELTR
ncbi:Na+/H+ antiporter subunit E [Skermanella mucosa]|uniref:Na+/H+ antiporter subunit E n=1 Tax=Skermanella mucosa TaxID=1789672 RepID=UPI00192B9EEF|nr:Na+/H+ antiporter subunit E [Skermanella mucosa]UEM21843.1 Na+/H+ antiporter subunit E [Skermanella mucosa]